MHFFTQKLGCCVWFLLTAQLSCLPSGSSLNWGQRGSGLDSGRHSNLLVTYLPHKQMLALGIAALGSTKAEALLEHLWKKHCCFWCDLWSTWAGLVHCHYVLSPALSVPKLFMCVCLCIRQPFMWLANALVSIWHWLHSLPLFLTQWCTFYVDKNALAGQNILHTI